MVYLDQILHIYLFLHCLVTDMQNGDEALLSIILAYLDILVKMLIILELQHNFD